MATTTLTALAAAHSSGTQTTLRPCAWAHNTRKTSGVVASASPPVATISARNRASRLRQLNDTEGAVGVVLSTVAGRPNHNNRITMIPGTTDNRNTLCNSTFALSKAKASKGPTTAPA